MPCCRTALTVESRSSWHTTSRQPFLGCSRRLCLIVVFPVCSVLLLFFSFPPYEPPPWKSPFLLLQINLRSHFIQRKKSSDVYSLYFSKILLVVCMVSVSCADLTPAADYVVCCAYSYWSSVPIVCARVCCASSCHSSLILSLPLFPAVIRGWISAKYNKFITNYTVLLFHSLVRCRFSFSGKLNERHQETTSHREAPRKFVGQLIVRQNWQLQKSPSSVPKRSNGREVSRNARGLVTTAFIEILVGSDTGWAQEKDALLQFIQWANGSRCNDPKAKTAEPV